jgi:hypothetical protein
MILLNVRMLFLGPFLDSDMVKEVLSTKYNFSLVLTLFL